LSWKAHAKQFASAISELNSKMRNL